MTEALHWLGTVHPTLLVDYRVVPGDIAELLIEWSDQSEAVVVPETAVVAAGTATMAERVAAHARCPVLVTHGPGTPGGGVVAAVDGRAPVDALLGYAFEEAALRGVAVRPTLVWSTLPDAALGTLDPFAYDVDRAHAEAERLLAEEVAGWAEKYPDVPVVRQAVRALDVADALLQVSATASLLVVGARSRPARSGLALGAVTRRLIRKAAGPVAVLRTA
jgi:nucleotide-binding universal stress UspA family protein